MKLVSPLFDYSITKRNAFIRALSFGLMAIAGKEASFSQSMPWGGFGEDYQVEQDSFQGLWEGSWEDGRTVEAQVAARGEGKYWVRIQDSFDQRYAPFLTAMASVVGEAIIFEEGDWKGRFIDDKFEGTGIFKNEERAFWLKKTVRLSPTLGREPPTGANVLFDGSDLEAWVSKRTDGRMEWKITDAGAMEIGMDAMGNGHSVRSRSAFKDIELHLEFRLPLMPLNGGQKRSNSGLFIDGYEIQILDSFGLEGYNNECGAFYKYKAPSVNRCGPPLQWQTYDVSYRTARFDDKGRIVAFPRFTVLHNGKEIHSDIEMMKSVNNKQGIRVLPRSDPSPIELQFHGARIQFRNIWVLEIEEDVR